ncbi:MAG: FAD/NAD(P)-binding protein [Candidatus Njordarchaeales archaeon]
MKNVYIPQKAVIENIREEAPDTRTFRIKLVSKTSKFHFLPGQFIELTVFGYGEAPFSISGKAVNNSFEITVREIGTVTRALFRKNIGDIIGIRGPFGRGWPLETLTGKNVLIIAGGLGLAPLRALIQHIIENRSSFGEVILLYGARTPQHILYKNEIPEWQDHIEVHLTVDKGDSTWRGKVGVVTVLLDDVRIDPQDTIALQCGPPIMMHFVSKKLKQLGFPDENIYLSLERLMKCGMGFCGKCTISGTYVCLRGPVFCYSEIRGFIEKIPEAGV